MSHTGGLRILARQNALTETDWFDLLEQRRTLIEPYLREMTLKSLGDLEIVRDQKGDRASKRPLRMGAMVKKTCCDPPHKYREAAPLMNAEGDFSLDTRGIFPDDEVYHNGHFKVEFVFEGGLVPASGVVTKFWGLTRNNQWIMAECTERYFNQTRYFKCGHWMERRSEVVKFIVSASTPQEICRFCGITPQWMWQRLGGAVEAWLRHREDLLARAEQLVEIINSEKLMVNIIAQR